MSETTSRTALNQAAVPLWILAVVAVTIFLREGRGLFVPMALALLASYALYPVVSWFDRFRLPRSASAAVVVAMVAGLAGWTGWVLSDDFAEAVDDLPRQVRQIRADLSARTDDGVIGDLNEAASEMQKPAEGEAPPGTPAPQASDGTALPAGVLGDYLWQSSANLLTIAGQVTVVIFLTYFLLMSAASWWVRLVRLSGTVLSSRRTGAEVIEQITWQVQRFLLMRLVTSVVVGVATWLALIAFGAPAPALWGTAAGIFNWVPYFGPIIVSGGLAIVGFVAGGFDMALQLSMVALVITSLEGWLLTPLLLGQASRMNTLAVFVSLLFWSWVWGIWGTILAVPLTSVAKAVADHVEPLSWLSDLLAQDSDRPRHS